MPRFRREPAHHLVTSHGKLNRTLIDRTDLHFDVVAKPDRLTNLP
jgi:hypothetical protein